MSNLIEPKVLKGFRDFLPAKEMVKQEVISRLETVFISFGFVPIDTPVMEYTEVLLGKGGGETDKQVYRFTDPGNRDVALRFDLTVPFARFIAAHEKELYLPFKRYHIGKAYRGENTQRGRYREFSQCDFDIVGSDSVSSDLEILMVMEASFRALGIKDILFRFSHRGVFSHFLYSIGLSDKNVEILRLVDKLPKIGEEEVESKLIEIAGAAKAGDILSYIKREDNNSETLKKIEILSKGTNPSIERLSNIIKLIEEQDSSSTFIFDPAITRGLDYYTGLVYETFLKELPEIGSVCSGGRYDNLASLYTKTELPGVGSSIGIDRLLAALEELGRIEEKASRTDVIILCMDEDLHGHYHALAKQFRSMGLNAEVYFDKKKIAAQFSFAEKKGIPYALICGPEEKENGVVNLRHLASRKSFDRISPEEAAAKIKTESGKNE